MGKEGKDNSNSVKTGDGVEKITAYIPSKKRMKKILRQAKQRG